LKIIDMNMKKGIVKLVPESLDDLWHLYNLIYRGDEVYARTTRLVKPDEEYGRPKKGERVSVFLGVRVEKVVWDRTLNRLRVHGAICQAPEDIVGRGSHHTLNIAVNTPLTLVKKEWEEHHLDRLKRASEAASKPIIVVSIDDEEYCVAFFRQFGVEIKVEERVKLPRKMEAEKRGQAVKKYFRRVLKALKEHWGAAENPPIVVIGVGFLKNEFVKYLEASDPEVAKAITDVKSVNNGGAAGIYEALRSGIFTKTLKHIRLVQESTAIEELLEKLGKGEPRITYGFENVKRAAELGAVEKLLLADTALRETSDEERRLIEELTRKTERKGGKVMVISTEHEAGEKLLALGGIAALLRFPIE
jgi:protein pelota